MAKNKKLIATVAAVATSAALLLGGTLAWQSTNQTALNEASDIINPGGRLHDDFDGTNKDVYVENFADEDIFARVRLEEFFEIIVNHGTDAEKTHSVIGTKKLKDGAVADPETNPSGANLYDYTYVVHKFNTTDNETEDAGIDREGTAFWNWKLGGSTVYMPTFNKNKDSLAADLNGNYVNAVGGISNRDDNQYENYVKYTDGETLEGTEIYDDDANDVDDDGILEVAEIEHIAKPTGSATLMSMQEWIDADSPVGEYWVYDTDGWVYWADAIKPDSATGLLLDGIELNQKMDDTWYYAINVVAQFVTADDLGSAEDGTGFYTETDKYPAPSEDALNLLDKIGVDVGNAGETPDAPGEDDFTPSAGTVTSDDGNISLYIDSPSISVNGNTITINPYAEEYLTYNAVATITGTEKTWQDVDKSINKLNTETNEYEECGSTPLDVTTGTGVDIDIATEDTYGEYAGTYMITAKTTDTEAEGNPTWQGELVLNVEYYQDSTGGEESPAYEPNLYTNAQTYVKGDQVNFEVYVYDYDETYDFAELTADNLSITATAADDNDVSDAITTTFSSDGYTATATLDTTGLTGAVTVAAVYTDAEGNVYPAEPITINEVFNASEFLTLDGKQTNVVHPGNNYKLAYTGNIDSYSFALDKGSDVATLDDNTLTINGDAAEYAQIAIKITDEEGNEVETASLTVTHTPIVKVVAPEGNKRELEVTPASNSDWVTVLANESVSLFMGEDVPLTIEKFSYAGDYDLTPDEIATINDGGTSITPHLGSTIVSTESKYTFGDLSFEVHVTMEVEFQYSVSVQYSLDGGKTKTLADESVIFLSDTDTITFYASSDNADTPPSEYRWKIGEHGNVGTENTDAFGPLEEDEVGSLNGVSTNTTGTYSIASVSDMEEQWDYHFYVSAYNHNEAWFQVILGEPAIDGANTIMQGDTQYYCTNDLKDYTYSVTPAIEGVEISRYGELYVPKDVPVGTVLTITATPVGHDGDTLTKEVTVVAFDYSSMVLYVDGYESYGDQSYTDGTTFTLSVEATDKNGDDVSASDLEWSVTDSGDTPIDNILTENGDGTYTLDLSGRTDTIHVHVKYIGNNTGENNSVSCAFLYDGEISEEAYLGRIEVAHSDEEDSSKNSDSFPVPIIDTKETCAVYFEAYDTNGELYSNVTWSCDPAGLVKADALESGKVIAAADASVSSIEELTITARDNTSGDTDTFTVMMYDPDVHDLVDTIDNGDYYHIFRPAEADESSTEYCVIRHDLPLPYCMLRLNYTGYDAENPDLWPLVAAYKEILAHPNEDSFDNVNYLGVCAHPDTSGANDNYPQDAAPMFSVASENGPLYWLGLADGDSFSEVYPSDTLQVTSTRIDDDGVWSVYNTDTDVDITNIATTSTDGFRSRITFTIPEGTTGNELVITQTIDGEEYSISTTVADPGPTFTVMLDNKEIAIGSKFDSVYLPIIGLEEDVTVTITSTYETAQDEGAYYNWYVYGSNDYEANVSPNNDYSITFTLSPTQWKTDDVIIALQHTGDGSNTFELTMRVTEAEEEHQ